MVMVKVKEENIAEPSETWKVTEGSHPPEEVVMMVMMEVKVAGSREI